MNDMPPDFINRVQANQTARAARLSLSYDFIVCGSGSSGSVVARRLAEIPGATVLLLEAGGDDSAPSVSEAGLWPSNLGSERDWAFRTLPNAGLNGRSLLWSMGKVLGGGSSINAMFWSRGHKSDWDHFAAASGNPVWGYDAVLETYKRIEDWRGPPDPQRRGSGGLMFVQPAPDPNPIAPAMLEAAASLGVPVFPAQNGAMMEGAGGSALAEVRIRNGKRLSVFRSYLYPVMDQPNLTVLTDALVTRLLFIGTRAVGVEVLRDGSVQRFAASGEVVLSLGAIQTPKLLMQSGIGDWAHLAEVGIDVIQHLPGVGRNLQEHIMLGGCVWESNEPLLPRNNGGEATFFWKSDPSLDCPDIQGLQTEIPWVSPETARLSSPAASWSMAPGVVRPSSRGSLRLTGMGPNDPVDIDANLLGDPTDLRTAVAAVALCREIGNSVALRPFSTREVMPRGLRGAELEDFIRAAVVPYWHYAGTAAMGRDAMAVVDGDLRVHGTENLRIADGSIMPRITTGNTMAPCVVIGEKAAEAIQRCHCC